MPWGTQKRPWLRGLGLVERAVERAVPLGQAASLMTPRKALRKKNKKPKGHSVALELAVVEKLQEVRAQRQPFRALTRSLISELLLEYGGLLPRVEIGAGDGQLRSLLPENALEGWVHTEPSALGVSRFLERHPEATVKRAAAEALPFADGEVGCVLGLCVLDLVKDGAAVAKECLRVLKPGGTLIHLLDMSVDPLAPIRQLQASRLLVIPNVFSDPCTTPFPEDLFVAPIAEVAQLVQILLRHQHPFATSLNKYVALFQAVPFSAAAAANAYSALSGDSNAKVLLRDALKAAGQLATPVERAQLAKFQGHPLSAVRHLQSRLQAWFSSELGFEVVLSDMKARFTVGPGPETAQAGPVDEKKYLSIAAGHVRHLMGPPAHLLCPDLPTSVLGGSWIEQSVFVFVARKMS